MAHSIWSGSISFALVNIPVKLYSAINPKDVHFHQLHDADNVRIEQKRVCPADGKVVPYEHIVKGYEISPNRYVVVKPEELEAIDPKATHTIDIQSFTQVSQIDPIYYEHSYYLAPNKGAAKPYALLMTAMQETQRAAIARVVIRTKQYVTVLRAMDHALSMSTLYYDDEIVQQDALDGLPGKDVKVDARELKMATQLVESLTEKFNPGKYKDEYRNEVLALIDRKAKGAPIVKQPAKREEGKVVNLMAALEASLAGVKKSAEGAPARPRKAEHHRRRRTA
jgi:DNA end-binding protein Ku